jgi:hypothetical protein
MPYDPREIELLRSIIVAEQMKAQRRGKGKRKGKKHMEESDSEDEELRGGVFSALMSLGSRLLPAITKAFPAVSRFVPSATKATSTAITPYVGRTVATTASRALPSLATSARSLASRLPPLSRFVPSASTALGVGVPLGFTAYQAVDYEKQKGIAEQQGRQAQAETDKALAEQQRQVDAEVAFYNEQRRLAELEATALNEARTREADEWNKMLKKQEEEALRQAQLEAQYRAEADRQYAEMMRQQQIAIDEAVRRQYEEMYRPAPTPAPAPSKPSAPAPPKPSAPAPAPSKPSAPSQPSAPTQPAPTTGADPYAGMSARERAIAKQKGRGKKMTGGRAKRGEIVRRVMKEKGLNLAQASKFVKDNNLY